MGLDPRDRLFTRTICWFWLCFELHVVMMRSMSNVFWEQQLWHWDHRAVSNARCGHPQGEGEGVSHMRTKGRKTEHRTTLFWLSAFLSDGHKCTTSKTGDICSKVTRFLSCHIILSVLLYSQSIWYSFCSASISGSTVALPRALRLWSISINCLEI